MFISCTPFVAFTRLSIIKYCHFYNVPCAHHSWSNFLILWKSSHFIFFTSHCPISGSMQMLALFYLLFSVFTLPFISWILYNHETSTNKLTIICVVMLKCVIVCHSSIGELSILVILPQKYIEYKSISSLSPRTWLIEYQMFQRPLKLP